MRRGVAEENRAASLHTIKKNRQTLYFPHFTSCFHGKTEYAALHYDVCADVPVMSGAL